MFGAFLGIALSLTDQTSRISVSTDSTVISDLAFTTSAFSSVKVENGAAIHVTGHGTGSMLTICGCLFLNNGILSSNIYSGGGGAIYCKSTTVICEDTDFRTCKAVSDSYTTFDVAGRGGAIYADDDSPMNISYCNFTSCTCEGRMNGQGATTYWGGGALYSKSSKISAFNCTFEECEAKANIKWGEGFGGAIFGLEIECHYCNFLSCHTNGYGGAISFGFYPTDYFGRSLTCGHCKFDNCSALFYGRVILIAYQNGTKSFLKQCIMSGSSDYGYGGIDPYRKIASDVSLSVVECTFEDCLSGDKLGSVIRITGLSTRRFVISLDTCTFITTKESAPYGLAPTISISGTWADDPTFTMVGCRFIGQQKQCVHFGTGVNWNGGSDSGQLFLQGCRFIQNTVDDNGLFSFGTKLPSGARFVNCYFEDNIFTGNVNFTCPMINDGSYSFEECGFSVWSCRVPVLFVPADVKVASLTIIGCTFEMCHSSELSGVLGRLDDTNCALFRIEGTRFVNCSGASFLLEVVGSKVNMRGNSEEKCVNLTNCTFLECHVGSGKDSLSVSNVVSITSVARICICDCVFEQCSSSAGAVVSLECDRLSMARDTISCAGFALSVSVSSGESCFEDIEFHRLSGVLCHDSQVVLSCPSGVLLSFYNCCFVHASDAVDCGVFLDVKVFGTIVFSRVCFDTVRDDAVSLVLQDGGNITFDGEESNFFGECECWSDQSTDPETTFYSAVESFYDESSVSESFYDESSVSESFYDESSASESFYDESSVPMSVDGPGGGGDDSAVKIGVGVAVGLLVVGCVVFLVIFLIRRRQNWATSSAGIAGEDQEIDTTDETVDARDLQSDLCVTEADITIIDDNGLKEEELVPPVPFLRENTLDFCNEFI